MGFKLDGTEKVIAMMIVLAIVICIVGVAYDAIVSYNNREIAIKAIEAGLVQDKDGNWVKSKVEPIQTNYGGGYGGSPGHLSPNEVEALRMKPKE